MSIWRSRFGDLAVQLIWCGSGVADLAIWRYNKSGGDLAWSIRRSGGEVDPASIWPRAIWHGRSGDLAVRWIWRGSGWDLATSLSLTSRRRRRSLVACPTPAWSVVRSLHIHFQPLQACSCLGRYRAGSLQTYSRFWFQQAQHYLNANCWRFLSCNREGRVHTWSLLRVLRHLATGWHLTGIWELVGCNRQGRVP